MAGAGAPVVGRRARDRRRLGETAEAARPSRPHRPGAGRRAAGLRPGMEGWPVAVRAGARHSRTEPRFGHARVRHAVRDDLVAGRVVVLPSADAAWSSRRPAPSGLRRELRRLVGLLEPDQVGLAVGAGRGEQERLRGRRLIVSTLPVGGVGRDAVGFADRQVRDDGVDGGEEGDARCDRAEAESGACAVSRMKTGRGTAPVSSPASRIPSGGQLVSNSQAARLDSPLLASLRPR